jgi:two-component system OmpR family sensor kinase
VISLVGLLAVFYYQSKKQLMFSEQRIHMMEYASIQTRKLKQLHRHFPRETIYPRDTRFKSAIFDLEYAEIFSILQAEWTNLNEVIYQSGEYIHLVKVLDDYYVGAKYLVIEVPVDTGWVGGVMRQIVFYGVPLLLLLVLFGIFLSRLFVKPMRHSIMLLDRFIKDTTHELNTPLSAILTNIEMIDRTQMGDANAKKLNRIEIGARTVSTLYEDLKILTLERGRSAEDMQIELLPLLQSRLEYFSLQMQSKQITLQQDLESVMMQADKRLIARVIDNLLSNAIKYNKRAGRIEVRLTEGSLVISDSGIGIPQEKLNDIFERYSRFNESEGGFGIGLNIVKMIAEHYAMEIDVVSELGVGTTVSMKWSQ